METLLALLVVTIITATWVIYHRLVQIRDLTKELDEVYYRFACLSDHATGGLLSKTGYDMEVYYGAIGDHIHDIVEEETNSLKTELDELREEERQKRTDHGTGYEVRSPMSAGGESMGASLRGPLR